MVHGSAAAVADLLVAPVADIEGAIRADFLRDGDEVHVVRPEEVGGVFADVGAGVRVGVVRDEAMAVEVAEEELVAIRRREEAALVDGEAAVRVTAAERVGVVVHHACAGRFVEADIGSRIAGVVRVVGDGLDVFIGVRVEVLPGLSVVSPTGDDVVEMRNDARGDEPLAMLVVIEPPRVAGAMREDLELMPHGMVTPHAGIDGLALVIRRARLADAAVREDAMAAIQPAVRAPDEAVESFVRVLRAPAVEEGVGGEIEAGDFRAQIGRIRRIGLIIPILVWNKHQIRRRPHPHTAEAELDATDEIQAVAEDFLRLEGAVAVLVFEDLDAVLAFADFAGLRVAISFHDPDAAAFVEGEGHRLHEIRLRSDELGFEAAGELHRLQRVGGRLALGVFGLRLQSGAVELLRREVGGGVLPLLREDEDARFVADDDVGQLVAIHIADLHIDADAGV